jgi:hypothetical protein
MIELPASASIPDSYYGLSILLMTQHNNLILLFLQYNSWFTFSDFQEPVTVRSCRPIHAKELTMVG